MRNEDLNTIGLPKQFIEDHINHHQLMRLLGKSEPEFFLAYLAGEIPPGVALSEFMDCNLIAWPRSDIEQWLAAGRPESLELADRRRRVLVALRNGFEAEHGVSLEQLAADMVAAGN
jgi:predicted DNA-binding transcriptional regulator AlpA